MSSTIASSVRTREGTTLQQYIVPVDLLPPKSYQILKSEEHEGSKRAESSNPSERKPVTCTSFRLYLPGSFAIWQMVTSSGVSFGRFSVGESARRLATR